MINNSTKKIKVTKDGPYLVSGSVPLARDSMVIGDDKEPESWAKGESLPLKENYALCRCGHSSKKPFCDGTHVKVHFDGTETANNSSYQKQSRKISGSTIDLLDAQDYCSSARFCNLSGGTWKNVENSNNPSSKKIAIQTACNCPSGRLTIIDKKTGKLLEPKLPISIGLIEDPGVKASGPIWLKGGIELESFNGTKYEDRNRMTVCRCGKSGNKPFCDGSHITVKFNDGDNSLKQ